MLMLVSKFFSFSPDFYVICVHIRETSPSTLQFSLYWVFFSLLLSIRFHFSPFLHRSQGISFCYVLLLYLFNAFMQNKRAFFSRWRSGIFQLFFSGIERENLVRDVFLFYWKRMLSIVCWPRLYGAVKIKKFFGTKAMSNECAAFSVCCWRSTVNDFFFVIFVHWPC